MLINIITYNGLLMPPKKEQATVKTIALTPEQYGRLVIFKGDCHCRSFNEAVCKLLDSAEVKTAVPA